MPHFPILLVPRIGRVERSQIRSSDMWGHGTTMERRAMTFFRFMVLGMPHQNLRQNSEFG